MVSSDRPATRLATRLSFLIAGFGIACWAPLVPFAKMRLDLDDGTLGILLLCIGIGSVAAMMGAGPLSARYGSKPVILVGGIGSAVMLPILPVAPTTAAQGIALLIFGAALGALDVASLAFSSSAWALPISSQYSSDARDRRLSCHQHSRSGPSR
jgi:MFS family permease